MSDYVREMTKEEIAAVAESRVKLSSENEELKMEVESLRAVIAWLNVKMLNQEKDRRW